jgi:HD-GYP domain-containing protein (c-di-GMP phosphodiesterase class II)
VAKIALQHHERWDGSGYPAGLKGEEIIPEARILAVADVVEAMASHRPYRPGLGMDAALAEIARGKGTSYETRVAEACLRLFREKGYSIPA